MMYREIDVLVNLYIFTRILCYKLSGSGDWLSCRNNMVEGMSEGLRANSSNNKIKRRRIR